MPDVTLSDGRVITLRTPRASDLRGVKLLDALQLEISVHAVLIERLSELSVAQVYDLSAADAMALITEVVAFFAQTEAPDQAQSASPSASKTPGP